MKAVITIGNARQRSREDTLSSSGAGGKIKMEYVRAGGQ